MASLGPVPVPAPLEPLLPYAKFAVAVAGVAATVIAMLVASPPSWVNLVIGAVTALGVFVIPNDTIRAVLVDGKTAVRAGEAAVRDTRTGQFIAAQNDVTVALRAVQDGATQAEAVVKDIKNV
jgi:hypothetical protein